MLLSDEYVQWSSDCKTMTHLLEKRTCVILLLLQNHIGERLSSHEERKSHLSAHKQWTELALRIRANETIDANHQRMLDDEARHWENVFEQLSAIIPFFRIKVFGI